MNWETTSTSYSYPQDCGPVLCLSEADATHGLDPLTGRRLWSLPGYGGAWPVAENRLLATTNSPETQDQILIDPATRDVVHNIYIRKVEKVDGELYNVEFDKIAMMKDPAKP